MNPMKILFPISMGALLWSLAPAADYPVRKVAADLSKALKTDAAYWQGAAEIDVTLLAQMMVKPKPAKAETGKVKVRIVHDGKYIAYRLRWSDKEISEAGKLGEFSDAVALEFPVLDHANPPPVFMGAPKNPVHLFHWRAQYQRDEELGKKSVKDIYPNMHSDIYPNEFPDRGKLKPATEGETEMFSPGRAAGNPQSSRKKAVDELMAEGFGTSVVLPGGNSAGRGEWKDGEWVVVISRALDCPGASVLTVGKSSFFGVAVWQGGADEVGARKALTMSWTPFVIEDKSIALEGK
jgi:DMSO reductase family type II enzyme heme b subunit